VVAEESGDEWTYYEKAEFVDPTGNRREAMAFSGVGEEEDAHKGEVTILYDPADPSNATIFKCGDFLIVLFLPFATLLIYLGWPSDEEGVKLKTNNQKPRARTLTSLEIFLNHLDLTLTFS